MQSKKIATAVSTFFGVGFIPLVPATWCSALVALLSWYMPTRWIAGFALVFSAMGLWACRPSQDIFNSKDPKQFVMDEACGMWLTVLWLPKSIGLYVGAFFLFRVLDVIKPWPISRIQNSKHPSSIMWDDLAAGAIGNILLQVFVRFTQ